jgi:adenylate kinase
MAEQYGLRHISSGDLYRAAIAAGTDLGRKVEPLLREGKLVPDEITVPLIRAEIEKSGEGFILDGYPRNLAQAEALDEMLEEIARPLSVVLLLELDDGVSRERMSRRATIEGRSDDTPEAIERRLATYHDQTEPVVEHYLATGKLVKVHAERSIPEVWTEIDAALEALESRA